MSGTPIVNQDSKKNNPLKFDSPATHESRDKFVDVAAWIKFLRHLRIPNLFASLPDQRQPGKIKYTFSSLMLWAFSTCAFRVGSKHAFQTELGSARSHQREGILNLLGIKGDDLPHVSTVDNALAQLPIESLNSMTINLVHQLMQRKFFYNHSELLPKNALLVGCDGFHTHTYDHPHATNKDGANACPYCLPRTYNKGTDKEITKWVHISVTVMLICNGITLPLYFYPLKAVDVNVEQSDEKLKQECELKATQAILPLIREAFPRMVIVFLGDSLYANRPMIRLCNELNIEYLIVLKDGSLKTLHKKCNELNETKFYQKYCTRKTNEILKEKTIRKQASWFNKVDLGEDVYTNVLRYQEEIHHKNGVCTPGYKGAWISSRKITNGNCLDIVAEGRSRWNQEDVHNTVNTRGYEMQHDMARTDPNLLMVWRCITLLATFVFTLFQYTVVAQRGRRSRSLKKFAQDMLNELLTIPWEIIKQSYILSQERVQFRYRFEYS
jgi:hypothetical protein